jgi:PTS system cellobiose-specific IIC component
VPHLYGHRHRHVFPFFKAYEKQLLAQEAAENQPSGATGQSETA